MIAPCVSVVTLPLTGGGMHLALGLNKVRK